MQEYIFKKDYRNNEVLRKSFFELAANTFDIKFETWYQQGFWGEGYIPFSFVDGDEVIANASVNILELIIHGEKKSNSNRHGDDTSRLSRERTIHSFNEQDFRGIRQQVRSHVPFANESVLDFTPGLGLNRWKNIFFNGL